MNDRQSSRSEFKNSLVRRGCYPQQKTCKREFWAVFTQLNMHMVLPNLLKNNQFDQICVASGNIN